MTTQTQPENEEFVQEVKALRQKAEEADNLREQLRLTQQKLKEFELSCASRKVALEQECAQHQDVLKALRMSQVIVDKSPVILFRRKADESAQLEYISDNLKQFGYDPEELLSGSLEFRNIVHPDDHDRVEREIHAYADADVEEYTMYYRCVTRDGRERWVEDQTSVIRDEQGNKLHNQGILIDITERKLARDALKASEEKHRRIVETSGEGFVMVDVNYLITDVNKAYCKMLGYTSEELIGKNISDIYSTEFKEYLTKNKQSLLKQEYRILEGDIIRKDGTSVPVLLHGNNVRNNEGELIGHMAFVTDMTHHKQSLVLAGEVQKSLLPREGPKIKGLDIAGRNVSCDEIGGDYFDFLYQGNTKNEPFNVVVGDISGHGVDSALLMTTARAFLRMRASQPGTISEIISAMNSHLAQDVLRSGHFMTLFYLSIDPSLKKIEWVRAGHDPALLYDSTTGEFEDLMGKGIALGVVDDIRFEENRREGLKNGQIIAIGTDGIWEASNVKGEMFGKERLRTILRENAHKSSQEILNEVYDQLSRFTSGQKSEDDITLVIIKIDGLQE